MFAGCGHRADLVEGRGEDERAESEAQEAHTAPAGRPGRYSIEHANPSTAVHIDRRLITAPAGGSNLYEFEGVDYSGQQLSRKYLLENWIELEKRKTKYREVFDFSFLSLSFSKSLSLHDCLWY